MSTYLPTLYIPDKPFSLPSAPIRALLIQDKSRKDQTLKGVEAITSPNYVTGLAAAILSNVGIQSRVTFLLRLTSSGIDLCRILLTIQLIHPATALVSASLILLPLPLSSVPNSDLLNALSQLSKINTEINLSTNGSKGRWLEADDEPYAQAGMGLGKNKPGRKADAKREVDSMYM